MVILSRRIVILETRLKRRENSCGKNALHLIILRRISISETLAPRTGNSFLRARTLFSGQWSREFFWKECLIANLMDRIAISGTLATRIGNSFLKNENSFQQAMKQRVLLERTFDRKSYEALRTESVTLVTRIRNSFSQERGFFLAGKEVEGSSGKNV